MVKSVNHAAAAPNKYVSKPRYSRDVRPWHGSCTRIVACAEEGQEPRSNGGSRHEHEFNENQPAPPKSDTRGSEMRRGEMK